MCCLPCAHSLTGNSISDGGGMALGKALEVNSSLETLRCVNAQLLVLLALSLERWKVHALVVVGAACGKIASAMGEQQRWERDWR